MSEILKLSAKLRTLKIKADGDSVQEDTEQEKLERERKNLEQKHKEELAKQFEIGYNEGQQSVKAHYESYYTEKLLERYEDIHRMFSDFDQKILSYEYDFEKICIETSMIIAEKILKREIEEKTIIHNVLQNALKKVLGANDVIIKINSSDYDKLFDKENAVTLDDSFAKVKFEKDDRIETGGCLVETEIGNVDARITTQLAEIKKYIDLNLSPSAEE